MQYTSIGLGDIIASLLALLGIHPIGTCGCDKRRRFLNSIMVPVIIW